MNLIGIGVGVWLIIDGVLSIVKYSSQSTAEHSIRVIRAVLGAVLILQGMF